MILYKKGGSSDGEKRPSHRKQNYPRQSARPGLSKYIAKSTGRDKQRNHQLAADLAKKDMDWAVKRSYGAAYPKRYGRIAGRAYKKNIKEQTKADFHQGRADEYQHQKEKQGIKNPKIKDKIQKKNYKLNKDEKKAVKQMGKQIKKKVSNRAYHTKW